MSGKFGTQEIKKVVESAVVVEASVIQVKKILDEGGLGSKLKLLPVAIHLLLGVQPLVDLDLTEFKNEILDLDATDDAEVLVHLRQTLFAEGQSDSSVDVIAAAVALVERTYVLVQDWVKAIKEAIAKFFP